MNKQIEEMAIALTCGECTDCSDCQYNDRFNCLPMHDAELLYEANYRKADEVASGVLDELAISVAKMLPARLWLMNPIDVNDAERRGRDSALHDVLRIIKELKMKYAPERKRSWKRKI